MARLLYECLFILQIRQWYWTWKALLSIKNYVYQHQNITIIIKGQSETCPISEIAIIILSPMFSGSFQAVAFSFTNLFFPSSRFRLLSSVRSLCCLPHFASTALRNQRELWERRGYIACIHLLDLWLVCGENFWNDFFWKPFLKAHSSTTCAVLLDN